MHKNAVNPNSAFFSPAVHGPTSQKRDTLSKPCIDKVSNKSLFPSLRTTKVGGDGIQKCMNVE